MTLDMKNGMNKWISLISDKKLINFKIKIMWKWFHSISNIYFIYKLELYSIVNISSKQIKQWVLTEGFHKVGIASAKIMPHSRQKLRDWLQRGNHASMEWIKKNWLCTNTYSRSFKIRCQIRVWKRLLW